MLTKQSEEQLQGCGLELRGKRGGGLGRQWRSGGLGKIWSLVLVFFRRWILVLLPLHDDISFAHGTFFCLYLRYE
ncbi:unnamed protein product [Gongylonema pulchrum]|uniref:Uncharacterized protein n=1 Tax=Gongylonema pulchrum TaxID=637853 RepID=A0A183DT53_9BILA|nr:unnamed protein product [Gongylonema pulchrum]